MGSMMIYDRQRSFKASIFQNEDPGGYLKALEVILKDGSFGGLKMYRLAKRVGDWKLSINFDHTPKPMPTW
jgi:hypothetical protein